LHAVAVAKLGPLVDSVPQVGDVRVQGAFVGVELVVDPVTKQRAASLQEAVAEGCLRRGVLVASSTTSFNIQPSLAMSPEAYAEALDRVIAAIEEAVA
jgi:4-aminobutyrate aminotransferase-like enzyme